MVYAKNFMNRHLLSGKGAMVKALISMYLFEPPTSRNVALNPQSAGGE